MSECWVEVIVDRIQSDRYLCSRNVLEETLLVQVPDDHETSTKPYNNLTGVSGVLMESLYMFQIPSTNVVIRYAKVRTNK